MPNQDMKQLQLEFDKEAREFYKISKKKCPKLTPVILEMFDKYKGAHLTAKVLLHSNSNAQSGFTHLWKADPKGLSMMKYTLEAQLLNPKFYILFNDEDRTIARQRLEEYGFDVTRYIDSLVDEVTQLYDEIRLIPMSPMEFNKYSIERVQVEYFLQILPYERDYKYEYIERGIDCSNGALLLFQLYNKIIASALYENINKAKHEILLMDGSINVFEPITQD